MASFGTMSHRLKGTTVRFEDGLAARIAEFMKQEGITNMNAAVNVALHRILPQVPEKEKDA